MFLLGGEGVRGDPDEDRDRDGYSALLKHATGTSDAVPSGSPVVLAVNPDRRFTLTLRRNLAADDIVHHLEFSHDLLTWEDASAVMPLLTATNPGDGATTLVYQSAEPVPGGAPRWFVRVKFELVP